MDLYLLFQDHGKNVYVVDLQKTTDPVTGNVGRKPVSIKVLAVEVPATYATRFVRTDYIEISTFIAIDTPNYKKCGDVTDDQYVVLNKLIYNIKDTSYIEESQCYLLALQRIVGQPPFAIHEAVT